MILTSYLKYVAKKQPAFIVYLSLIQQQLRQQPYLLVVGDNTYTLFGKEPLPPVFCSNYVFESQNSDIYASLLLDHKRQLCITEEKKIFVHTDSDYDNEQVQKNVERQLKQGISISSKHIMVWFTPQQLLDCDLMSIEPSIADIITMYLKHYDRWQRLGITHAWECIREIRKEQNGPEYCDLTYTFTQLWNQHVSVFDVNIISAELLEMGCKVEDLVTVQEVFYYHGYTMKCIAQDEIERYFKIGRYSSNFIKRW